MLERNVETFIGCDCAYDDAEIVLYGAPFDSTTSFRPGARFGSSAMRHESFGLETYSPYQDRDLCDAAVFDSGDLELCFGKAEQALQDIEASSPCCSAGSTWSPSAPCGPPQRNTPTCTSSSLTPTPICGRITSGRS